MLKSVKKHYSRVWFDVDRKGSRNRATDSQCLLDSTDSLQTGVYNSRPPDAVDSESSSSSERTDSDSEVSVDDDEGRGSVCAAVPEGLSAASRLRLLVASEEERRRSQLAVQSAGDVHRPPPGQIMLDTQTVYFIPNAWNIGWWEWERDRRERKSIQQGRF